MKSSIIVGICRILDILLLLIAIPMAFINKYARKHSFNSFPILKKVYLGIGVFPIINHYYDPLFDIRQLKKPLELDRNLPGIEFNDAEQLQILQKFNYNEELLRIPLLPHQKTNKYEYCYTVGPFLSGDSEYLYNMIRYFRPGKIIEIGSGHSTLMAKHAIEANYSKDRNYQCIHICIEPFENNWLEELGVQIIREKVENLDTSFFNQLEANDILFIDSSHMIRPQGDVLYEYLELLPMLKSGVIIHIHDIFSPKDYPDEWIKLPRFWNEQYLLEAFLTNNRDYRIIGATNYLMHKYYSEFSDKCPVLKMHRENGINRQPGSFWMIKN